MSQPVEVTEMDCREARIAVSRGGRDDPAVAAHLGECRECRAAVAAVEAADERLVTLFPEPGRPSDAAVDRAAHAAGKVGRRARIRPLFLRAAAAALLLAAGGLAGWMLRGDANGAGAALPPALAEHELAVFREVRESLGGDLAWLATVNGEVVLGLTGAADGPHRVVLLELRDAKGRVRLRPRLVVPEGREVEVAAGDAPRMRVRAVAAADGGSRVTCSLEFPDGSRLAAADVPLVPGRAELIGKVNLNGDLESVYVACR